MLRHSVLWRLRDTTTPAQAHAMLQGLAFLRMECPMVQAGDYGDDLFGGSSRLRAVPPWERTPWWHGRAEGPPSNFDVALHLDFDGWEGHDAYGDHPAHAAGSAFNETVAWDELTARVDWLYDGKPVMRRGLVRHTEMFVWADEAGDVARSGALETARGLAAFPGLQGLAIGQNIGRLKTDFDWILDVQLDDVAATRQLLEGGLYRQVTEALAGATKYEWTARISHVIRGL